MILHTPESTHVHRLTINRPERKNALNTALLLELAQTLERLVADGARAIVIHGSEGDFAAGADIDEIADLSPQQALLDARVAAWQRIRHCPIPLIAAVQGYCLGGGVELLLACDFALADSSAQFGLPEVKLGVMPGAGGTQLLPRLIGKARAAQMVYSGQLYDAGKMADWGLITDVVSDQDSVLQSAIDIATKIARNAPFAVRQAKQSLLHSQVGSEDGMKFERQAFSLLSATDDKAEGIAAFKAKRHAVFRGK